MSNQVLERNFENNIYQNYKGQKIRGTLFTIRLSSANVPLF